MFFLYSFFLYSTFRGVIELKDNIEFTCFSKTQQYSIIFNFLATSFGRKDGVMMVSSSSSSVGTTTPHWVLACSTIVGPSQQEGFYIVPLPAARQTPNLEDQ